MRKFTAGALVAMGLACGLPIAIFGFVLAAYAINQCVPGGFAHDRPNGLPGLVGEALGNAPCLLTSGHWLSVALGVLLVIAAILIAGAFFVAAGKVKDRKPG